MCTNTYIHLQAQRGNLQAKRGDVNKVSVTFPPQSMRVPQFSTSLTDTSGQISVPLTNLSNYQYFNI